MSTYLGRFPHNHKDLTGKKYNILTVYTSVFYGFRCKGFHFDFLKGGI